MPDIVRLKKNFIEARLNSDARDPVLRKRIAELIETVAETPAQPTYVTMDPDTEKVTGRFRGPPTRLTEEFKVFLEDAVKASGSLESASLKQGAH